MYLGEGATEAVTDLYLRKSRFGACNLQTLAGLDMRQG